MKTVIKIVVYPFCLMSKVLMIIVKILFFPMTLLFGKSKKQNREEDAYMEGFLDGEAFYDEERDQRQRACQAYMNR